MESLADLGDGFLTVLTPINMLWVLIGAVLGTAVGVLPGLGSAMAVALLLPVTFGLDYFFGRRKKAFACSSAVEMR